MDYNNVDMSEAPSAAEDAEFARAMRVGELYGDRMMKEYRWKEEIGREVRKEIVEEQKKLAVKVGMVGGVLALLGAGVVAVWMRG